MRRDWDAWLLLVLVAFSVGAGVVWMVTYDPFANRV